MKKILLMTGLLAVVLVVGCAKKPAINQDDSTISGEVSTGATNTGTVQQKVTNVDIIMGTDLKISADQKGIRVGAKIGGSHSGTVDLLPESYLSIDSSGAILGGKISIAMNTMTVTDVTDSGMNAKLVTHLKGADFFDVASNPTAVFAAKSISGNVITADVSIRGITKELSFPVTLVKDNDGFLLSTELKITRSDFKIGDTLLGKVALEDTFTITLDKVAFFR